MDFLEIEKIILQDDTRGMSSLYELINKGFIERSADLLLNTKGKIFICSGFYILKACILPVKPSSLLSNLCTLKFKFSSKFFISPFTRRTG